MLNHSYCEACNEPLDEDEIWWAFEEPYCITCYRERFSTCSECDELLHAEDGHYTDDSCLCDECYEKFGSDPEMPENPVILPNDREEILNLCRTWLYSKKKRKQMIKINSKDIGLSRIRELVGHVSKPVYVFGLVDREEYDVSVSIDLKDRLMEYRLLHGLPWRVIETDGNRRIGFTLKLRSESPEIIANLLKSLCKHHKPIKA
ncbi:MAG: hypothetical protein LCH52_16495 [Bacteroidetes bacterium]|nr:hypothetical protein [Bacteroidota bacterium]